MPVDPNAMPRYLIVFVAVLLMVGGCAHYAPKPLPQQFSVPDSPSAVKVDVRRMPREVRHVWNPADGLDSEETAMLAVANNPQLRASRAALGVARAQVFAAGLLADPQLAFNEDYAMTPGTQNAWALGLGFDVGDWLMRSSRQRVARAGETAAAQQLLWQEWQVIGAARLGWLRVRDDERLLPLLQQEADGLRQRSLASRAAAASGNLPADAAATAWQAWQAAQSRCDDGRRQLQQDRLALNALLGLGNAAQVELSGEWDAALPDVAALRAQIGVRLDRRPDLRALRAAYVAQEASYRAAVLAQFPLLGISINRAQDNYGDNSVGPGIVLSLPVFNRNRGNIAIARASRQQLYDEYRASWLAARNEVEIALGNLPWLEAQARRLRRGLPQVGNTARAAGQALRQGNLTAADAQRLRQDWLDRRMDLIRLAQSLAEQQIALGMLLGPDLLEQKTP